jgi:hypothetical protein
MANGKRSCHQGTGFRFLDEHGIDQPNANWVSFGDVGTSNISLGLSGHDHL